MRQGVYIDQPDAKTGAGVIPNDSFEDQSNRSSALLLEQPLDTEINFVEPLEVLPVQTQTTSDYTELLVRCFDIVGACIMLLLASPLMLVATVLVKLSSAGPVLYKQNRVGERGRIFTLYKFRTMVNNAEKHTGPVWAAKDDDRVTPLGRIFRRARLDELPQLFNVLKGDMSLVGPRPERPYFVSRHKALQGVRLVVKPGITGPSVSQDAG